MAQEELRVAPRHYLFLSFLTLLNVMNFVDRQLLASFANFIKPELALSDTEYALLTGFAFIVFYVTMGLFMGVLADRLHRPRLVALGLTLWSLLTAASGAAKGFASLALPRVFIGVGESVLTPTSMSMLSDRFPTSRMGFASGFYYMGVPIGVGVSLLIAGYLGPAIGWRNCFYILGALGLVFALIMLFVKETPRKHLQADTADNNASETNAPGINAPGINAPDNNASENDTRSSSGEQRQLINFKQTFSTLIRALKLSPALGLTMAGGVALHFILGAAAFDQLWFVEERGFERAYIAQTAGWIGMFAGILGNLFGGIGSDWFMRRTGVGRAMFLFWIMLFFLPINIAYRLVPPDSLWFWIGIFAGFFQLGSFFGPTFSTVQELVPPEIRATVVAFYILSLNLIGLGLGITLGGISVDMMREANVAEPYTWMLLIFTLLSAAAIPLFWLAGRRYQQDREALLHALSPSAQDAPERI